MTENTRRRQASGAIDDFYDAMRKHYPYTDKLIDSFIAHTNADQKLGHEDVFLEMCESVPPLTRREVNDALNVAKNDGRAPRCSSWTASTRFYAQLPDRAARCPAISSPSSAAPDPCRAARSPASATARPISARLREMAGGGPLESPEDIRRVIDGFGYLDDWRSELPHPVGALVAARARRITCIDAAILAYGLLELLFPETQAAPARHPPPRSREGRGVRPLRRALLGRRRARRRVHQVELHGPRPPRRRSSPTRRRSPRATPAATWRWGSSRSTSASPRSKRWRPTSTGASTTEDLNELSERIAGQRTSTASCSSGERRCPMPRPSTTFPALPRGRLARARTADAHRRSPSIAARRSTGA